MTRTQHKIVITPAGQASGRSVLSGWYGQLEMRCAVGKAELLERV